VSDLNELGTPLYIVILNWNGTSDTLRCLASLTRVKRDHLTLQVIVVDNGSDVDPTPEIRTTFPGTKIIRLARNIGFAAGCNVGIKEATTTGAEYVLFLNNDAEVESDFLLPLIAALQSNRKVGLACSYIKTMDGAAVDFAGAVINFPFGSFKPLRDLKNESSLLPTDYATGCSLLVPVRILKAIGTFDEKLFSYFEDTDLSLRAKRAGFEIVLVPKSVVRHKGSASTRRGLTEGTTSPLKHYLIARNRIILIRRYGSILSRIFFIGVVQPLMIIWYLVGFFVRRRPKKARSFLSGIYDGLINPDAEPQIDKWR
jgi:GT2 family glycosyltransferase